ncbi:proteasome assembly chaperone family protein [Candidatus Woesearchaeota archaeon]|nr:proteasome assembly chaperone family protein [Candidatus Woesearchaeota archaeon]
MELVLNKKPQGVTIVEGFPGFGFVGTISVEFLIEHTKAEKIGRIQSNDVMPVAAVHNSQLVEPLSIYYSKKKNLVFVHAISNIQGLEWQIADMISELCKTLKAKKLISLEGIASATPGEPRAFYYTTGKVKEKVEAAVLKEGIVMGVTGALLLRSKVNMSCIFAETHSSLPDSRAAAKIIEVLDSYLGLKIDYKPLLKKAEEFEAKLKGLVEKSRNATDQKAKKELDYFG